MRRAFKNFGVFKEGDNIAITLGFDFCSEHEQGIRGIERSFGFGNPSLIGMDRFRVTNAMQGINIVLHEHKYKKTFKVDGKTKTQTKKNLYLVGGSSYAVADVISQYDKRHFYPHSSPNDDVSSAWDENGFSFSLPSDHASAPIVREIYAAFATDDVAIFMSGKSNPFANNSLTIARFSTIPDQIVSQFKDAHLEAKALSEAADKTGVRSRIDEWHGKSKTWGKAYFSLSPKWSSETDKGRTAHPVVFWLNPYRQDCNNYGWFTVEQLDQWIAGDGPIPKG